jgi:hypothetical protein
VSGYCFLGLQLLEDKSAGLYYCRCCRQLVVVSTFRSYNPKCDPNWYQIIRSFRLRPKLQAAFLEYACLTFVSKNEYSYSDATCFQKFLIGIKNASRNSNNPMERKSINAKFIISLSNIRPLGPVYAFLHKRALNTLTRKEPAIKRANCNMRLSERREFHVHVSL